MAGGALRGEDRRVDRERAAGEPGVAGEQVVERPAPIAGCHETRGRDGARVDHRVEGHAGAGRQGDRVERLARRLDADPGADGILAQVVEHEAVGERLGDRLDRERHGRVADRAHPAIEGHGGDPEPRRVGAAELGDVGRDRAVGRPSMAIVDAGEVAAQRRDHRRRRRGHDRDAGPAAVREVRLRKQCARVGLGRGGWERRVGRATRGGPATRPVTRALSAGLDGQRAPPRERPVGAATSGRPSRRIEPARAVSLAHSERRQASGARTRASGGPCRTASRCARARTGAATGPTRWRTRVVTLDRARARDPARAGHDIRAR